MASEQLEATIEVLRTLSITSGDIDADRAAMGASSEVPADLVHEMVVVDARPAAWITEGATGDGAILYLHGGGYVMGGLSTHSAFGARLGAETGLPVLVLDYRLAPEHVYPAALDDALAAFDWLVDKGIDADRIVVAGDSAGGGLTLTVLTRLRDRGTRCAAGVMLSPWTDLTGRNGSHRTQADADPLVDSDALAVYARAYAGDTALTDPGVSPGLGDVSGLPPVLIQVGGREVLLDDSLETAAAIQRAGGDVTLQRWDEAIHVFQILGAPESDEAISAIAEFLAAH
ncbi:MAG: alpha/beta hydrolase [Acidimicrobiales bacterium]